MDLITSRSVGSYNRAVLAQQNDVKIKSANLDNDLNDIIYWELYLGLLGGELGGRIAHLLFKTIQLENV